MSLSIRALLAILPAMAIGACTDNGPLVNVYPGTYAQKLSPSNSMLGEACDGHDFAHSLREAGHTRLIARFDISTLNGIGGEMPYDRIAGPADEGISQVARPDFARAPGAEACGGEALRTVMVREHGILYLDWKLEMAPPGGTGTMPAEPWRVTGRSLVNEVDGTASGTTAFNAFGRSFVARLTATPGPVFVSERRAREAREAAERHPYPNFATPLPDERPGRTLQDVTIQH